MRRHLRGTPNTGAALTNSRGQLGGGAGLTSVALGDRGVSGPDDLTINGVARGAVAGLHELLAPRLIAGVRLGSGCRRGYRQYRDEGSQNHLTVEYRVSRRSG